MEKNRSDIIIIGGGFAGVTAARELSHKGYTVTLLEARERLGGRTWTDTRLGHEVEMGGTWVHWFQPHIWAEISRYQLEVVEMPAPEEAYWIADGRLEKGTPEELLAIIGQGMNRFLESYEELLPNPYNTLAVKEIIDIDHISVKDRLDALKLSKREYDLVSGLWAAHLSGPLEEGGLTQALRWLGLSNNDWELHLEICATYKIKNGTKALINAMINDANANVILNKKVVKVNEDDRSYCVETEDGDIYSAKAILVTLPITILNTIEFHPPLSVEKRKIANEGQTSKGLKVWAKVRNVHKPFVAMASHEHPISYLGYNSGNNDESLLVGFGTDITRLDINDKNEVEKVIQTWLPDVEVIDCFGHDWVRDPFTRETQPVAKTNQLQSYIEHIQAPDKGIFIAGSGYADGWAGLMDGAIESAFKASNAIHEYLIGYDTGVKNRYDHIEHSSQKN